LLIGCNVRNHEPRASAAGPFPALIGACLARLIRLHLADGELQVARAAVAPHGRGDLRAGLVEATMRRRSLELSTGLPSYLMITSPGFTPALSAGPSPSTLDTSAPAARGMPIASATSRETSPINTRSGRAPPYLCAQLLADPHRLVDRDGERDSRVGPGRREICELTPTTSPAC